MRGDYRKEVRMEPEIDLVADLNAQDDDGYGWSLLSEARDPSRVIVGRMLLAGNAQAVAVVRVVAVDEDGQVHFVILPGPVSKNRHLLDHASA
jgi:hypothetical protein